MEVLTPDQKSLKYRAVIFDLFGTLVHSFPVPASEETISAMAQALGAPREEFARLWDHDTWPARASGRFPTIEANLRHICNVLGVEANAEQISRAAGVRTAFTQRSLIPKPDTIETLARLKETGHRVGLISDCSMEVPDLWPETPMAALIDAPVFSPTAGMVKPNPLIYQMACMQLAVSPADCLYVGIFWMQAHMG